MLKRKFSVITAVLIIFVMATGCTFSGEKSVATMGSEKITTSEYNFFLSKAKSQVQQAFGESGTVDWKAKIENQTVEEFAKQMALQYAWEFKINLSKAKAEKVDLTKAELTDLNKNIDDFIKSQGTTGIDQEKKIKEQYGVSVAQFKSISGDYAQTQKYTSEWMGKVKYTEDDLKKYYEENKDSFDIVSVRHILFMSVDTENKPLPADKLAAAEKSANDVLAKVKAGEDMVALAEKYSEDPGVKENKGEYSFDSNGKMSDGTGLVKEFPDFAFKHKVGDADIVKTDYGFHVIKLEKRTAYEDVKENVKNGFLNKKYTDELEKWKKDSKYKLVTDQPAIDAIKIA